MARGWPEWVDRVSESDMPNSVNLSALLCFPIVRSHVVGQRARSAFELAQQLQKAAGYRSPQIVFIKAAQMPADLIGYNQFGRSFLRSRSRRDFKSEVVMHFHWSCRMRCGGGLRTCQQDKKRSRPNQTLARFRCIFLHGPATTLDEGALSASDSPLRCALRSKKSA
jgi:hypothetical protein